MHETKLQLPQARARKRKSTIGKNDESSRKIAKMNIEGGGSLDSSETSEAGSKCPHPFFNTEEGDDVESVAQQFEKIKLARMEKAEKFVREQRWVKRSPLRAMGLLWGDLKPIIILLPSD